MLNVLKFILKNLDQYRSRFWLVFFVGLLDGAGVFFIPILLAEFTKKGFNKSQFSHLLPYLVGIYLFTLLTSWIIRRYGESLAHQFENYLRYKYFKMLEHLPATILQKYHSGYILSLINKIGSGVQLAVFGFFWNASRGIITLLLFFIFTARESLPVTLMNGSAMLVFLILGVYLSRKNVPLSERSNRHNASLLESYADFIANLVTIKKLAIYRFAESRLEQKTKTSYDAIQEVQNFHALRWAILHLLFGIAYIGTTSLFLYNVASGRMAASSLILFVSAYYILFQNLNRLTEIIKGMMEIKAYILTLEEIINQSDTTDHSLPSPRQWENISFTGVEFQYPNTQKQIVVPEFHLQPGEKVAITGTSGLGKTTFLNLFNNFLVPDSGQRLVDGRKYETVHPDFFGQTMVIISQEIELFNLSLRENIALEASLSDDYIKGLLAQLDLMAWVSHLQNGLDTIVGEKGVRLSAGQKQRVNLLRGLLLDRQIYLLDEPTSHLDLATEERVVSFLKDFLRDKTSIMVTHRPALMQLCSRFYNFSGHTLIAKDR